MDTKQVVRLLFQFTIFGIFLFQMHDSFLKFIEEPVIQVGITISFVDLDLLDIYFIIRFIKLIRLCKSRNQSFMPARRTSLITHMQEPLVTNQSADSWSD